MIGDARTRWRSGTGRRGLAVLVMLLAACTGPGLDPASAPAPSGPRVTLRTVEAATAVEIVVSGLAADQRVKLLELVAPDGARIAAGRYDRKTPPQAGLGRPRVGVGVAGGSSGRIGTGVQLSFPVQAGGARGGGAVTTARIALADPAAYRATAADWTVVLTIADVGDEDLTAVFPAPLPN